MNFETLKTKINEELGMLEHKFIILVNMEPEHHTDSVLEIVKFMTDREMGGIYITSLNPYHYMKRTFKEYHINAKNLFFIDLLSCMAGSTPEMKDGCAFIETPAALEEIGFWVNKLMQKIDAENKFLIIDSFSTLLIYNNHAAVEEFNKSLIDEMRRMQSISVFASTSTDLENRNDFYTELAKLCDRMIKFD